MFSHASQKRFFIPIRCVISIAFCLAIAFSPKGFSNVEVTQEKMLSDIHQYFGDIPLLDQHGQHFKFFDLIRDKVVVLTPFLTRCENFCPSVMGMMLITQQRLGDRFGNDVLFLSVTSDPEYDRPEIILDYVSKFGIQSGWHFLTGRPDVMDYLQRRLGFILQKETPPPQQHSVKMYIMDAKKDFRVATVSGQMDPDCLVKILDKARTHSLGEQVPSVAKMCWE